MQSLNVRLQFVVYRLLHLFLISTLNQLWTRETFPPKQKWNLTKEENEFIYQQNVYTYYQVKQGQ